MRKNFPSVAGRKRHIAKHRQTIAIFLITACISVAFGAVDRPNLNRPVASNDERILFQSNRDGNWEVYVMRTDGSEQTNLSHNLADDIQPSASPDGSRIVFVSNRTGNYEIFLMDTDGSHNQRLTNNAFEDVYPAWSPDGRKIAF